MQLVHSRNIFWVPTFFWDTVLSIVSRQGGKNHILTQLLLPSESLFPVPLVTLVWLRTEMMGYWSMTEVWDWKQNSVLQPMPSYFLCFCKFFCSWEKSADFIQYTQNIFYITRANKWSKAKCPFCLVVEKDIQLSNLMWDLGLRCQSRWVSQNCRGSPLPLKLSRWLSFRIKATEN